MNITEWLAKNLLEKNNLIIKTKKSFFLRAIQKFFNIFPFSLQMCESVSQANAHWMLMNEYPVLNMFFFGLHFPKKLQNSQSPSCCAYHIWNFQCWLPCVAASPEKVNRFLCRIIGSRKKDNLHQKVGACTEEPD